MVQILTGLGSGLVGSLVGAQAQRWQYKQQRREENRRLLWQYEQVLEDEGDYLTHDTYFPGTKGFRRHEDGELDRARSGAYAAIQQLPAELRDDLIKDTSRSTRLSSTSATIFNGSHGASENTSEIRRHGGR